MKQRKKTKGSWSKGKSGNPAGRPKGATSKYTAARIIAIMEEYAEKHKKKPPLEYLSELFYSDEKVRLALINKIFTDKIELEGEISHLHKVDPDMDLSGLAAIFDKKPQGTNGGTKLDGK